MDPCTLSIGSIFIKCDKSFKLTVNLAQIFYMGLGLVMIEKIVIVDRKK